MRKKIVRLKIAMIGLLLIWISPAALAQNLRTVQGTVYDKNTLQLFPGVSVKVKGDKGGAITDQNGKFSIQVKNTDVLIFSYLGYTTNEVTVAGQNSLKITLAENQNELNDVLIVGYGSVKKKDLTGSVGQVKMSDLEKAPVTTFDQALAGRVAGVQVNFGDAQPGSLPNITIRGIGSLTQSSAPLYVIDGFPVEDFLPGSINTEDIESIEVLKDASATAIYGARASNGVIMLQTKKGKLGKTQISFNTSIGFQQVPKKIDLMNPYEFVKYYSELRPESTKEKYFAKGETLDSYKDSTGVNWQDLIYQQGLSQIYGLGIRGATDKTKYAISGSLFDQKGIILNTGANRYQGRVSIDQQLNSKLTVGVNSNYSYQKSYGVVASEGSSNYTSYLLYNTWGYRPTSGSKGLNLVESDGDVDNISASEARVNPVKTAENTLRENIVNELFALGYLNYTFSDQLSFKSTGNISTRTTNNTAFYNSQTPQGSPIVPSNFRGINGYYVTSNLNVWSNENVLTYNNTFNNDHSLNIVGGFSMQKINRSLQGKYVQNLPNEVLGINGFSQGEVYNNTSANGTSSLVSYFGRAAYNYKSKYMLTATLRGDASSKFSGDNRWGYFPSAALGWNMKEESFLKSFETVSLSKLRFSYGITGNNRIDDFAYLPQLSVSSETAYSYNNQTPILGAVIAEMGNQSLRWEKGSQIDLGYDLSLFKDRLSLVVDVYRKDTKDLLLNADLPYTTGFSTAYKNVGALRNDGLEISLNTINIDKRNFGWNSNFNITFNKNKVLALSEGQNERYSFIAFETQFNTSPLYISEVGKPLAQFYGYKSDGLYQYADFDQQTDGTYVLKTEVANNGNARTSIKPGDVKYKDINNDGVVNGDDRTVLGSAIPQHMGGFTNNFRYKNFDLSVFLQWSYGNKIYNANRLMFDGNVFQRTDLNQYASYIDRWSPENQNSENFRVGGQGPQGVYSDRNIEDGSYLRLKTVSLGYSLPKSMINKWSINALRFSVDLQNLHTWTNYSGMDPEVSVRNTILTPGFDYSAYPLARTVIFKLSASL